MDVDNLIAPTKLETGIEGLDHVTMGGLLEGRTTLCVGSSGTGKTILAAEFLYRGITKLGRKGVFVTFEERPRNVIRNVKKFGWDLDDLVRDDSLRFVDASPPEEVVEETGIYDLSGLVAQLKYQVDSMGATIVVMDSLGSIYHQFTDSPHIRREIFRITEILRDLGVTAMLTAERLEEYGQVSRLGIEEYVTDSVIVLRNVLDDERCRRTIQVLKMRGDTHAKGEYPFTISDRGISVMALSAVKLQQSSSNVRISSGNKKLDEMTDGGIFRDSVLLVSGPTGGGKTLMATTFTEAGCAAGERALLVGYEESRHQLLRNAESWGLGFADREQEGLLRVVCLYPEAQGTEDHLLTIRRQIEEFKPQRLVIDSISAMERVANIRNFREFVIGLTSYVKQQEICTLLTCTSPKLSGGESVTEAHISTITDIIVLLRYVEIDGVLRRGIAVIKMRGSQHEKAIHEFSIDHQGMHIGAPFRGVHNIILGIPTSALPTEEEQLGELLQPPGATDSI